jgi:tripartite-type tricarboxylate transporter receptor subunit TctC
MRRRAALLGLGSALVSASTRTHANERDLVRIVVPYAPGGQTDSMARLLAEPMQKVLGRTVIIDNKPGASALIATKYVQGSPPDSDTLLFHNSGFVALPMLNKAATYNPTTDFDAVAMVGNSPNFLMVVDSVPAHSVAEFIAYAKTIPQGIDCGNSGINSGGHISAMLLEKMAGIKLNHIPYKGSAEVTRALLGGEVKMQVSVTTDSLNPYIKNGKIRMLGVASREPSALAPNVPPIGNTLPGYVVDGWFGMLTSAHSPLEKREAMSAAIKAGLESPLVRERFVALYMDIIYQGPETFGNSVKESEKFFRKIVDQLGLVPT